MSVEVFLEDLFRDVSLREDGICKLVLLDLYLEEALTLAQTLPVFAIFSVFLRLLGDQKLHLLKDLQSLLFRQGGWARERLNQWAPLGG